MTDITSKATVPATKRFSAVIATRKAGVSCGIELVETAFRLAEPALKVSVLKPDGAIVREGDVIAEISGPAAKAAMGHLVKVEIEVDTLAQPSEVIAEGADVVLLDNMSNEQLRQAVAMVAGRMRCEASGNVTLTTVRAIAETGVDIISSGALTHSASNLDLGLDIALD